MTLASDRAAGKLVCRCPVPSPRMVVLFDTFTLADVHECCRCGLLILHPQTPGAPPTTKEHR